MNPYRNTTPVVADTDGIVGMDDHADLVAIPGKRFVDGVIDHLEHHVVQAGTVVRITDIHPRSFPDCV